MQTKKSTISYLSQVALIVGGVLVVALILLFTVFSKTKIYLTVDPANAVVTLDNKPLIITDGKVNASAKIGQHILKVEADDYIGFKEQISLGRGRNFSKTISLVGAPKPTVIADGAKFITLSGNQIFYQNQSDKIIYRSNFGLDSSGGITINSTTPISVPIAGTPDLIWSPTRDLLVLKRGTTATLFDFKKYDFLNQKETPLSSDVGDVVFAPDNSRIAYVYQPAGGERSIIFTDLGGGNVFRAANLKSLNIFDPQISFSPDSQWLSIVPRNQSFGENKIYLMNVYTKEVRLIDSDGDQKSAKFSPDSQKIIFSTFVAGQKNFDLSVINLDGTNKKKLNASGDASQLKSFDLGGKIFLPSSSGSGKMGMYDVNTGASLDYFFKLDSAKITEIALTENRNGVFFVSDGKLYFVTLKSN
ncbi:MAG: hypothetical protein NTW79_02095 [Candidatus Berkelbacteria bacterium]|nr:hypothetical protein [Candidatus Berkelbacteria bacterium]